MEVHREKEGLVVVCIGYYVLESNGEREHIQVDRKTRKAERDVYSLN
jgi:hypothetical protein